MNQQMIQKTRNEVTRLIRVSNRHKNVIRISANKTNHHINMKVEICKFLCRLGKEYYTEAIFENGSRADIVNADDKVIYEVLESESQESIDEKIRYYPLNLVAIKANQKFEPKLLDY